MIDNPLILSFLIALTIIAAELVLFFILALIYSLIGDGVVIVVALGILWFIYQIIVPGTVY